MELAELKTLVEQRQKRRQAAIAFSMAAAIFGLFLVFMPKPAPQAPAVAATVATSSLPNAYANVPVHAKAAIVYDLTNDQVLYAKNAQQQLPLASITKLLTVYAASKVLASNSPVTITPTALSQYGEYGLSLNQDFSFNDLARFALVGSSNDAAEAIAEAGAKAESVSNTALLASAVSATGLTQTYALNGTGLDESTTTAGAYGSAEDVAQLAGKFLAEDPSIAAATTQSSITVKSTDGIVHTLPNTDEDVGHIPRLLLSKTGYTDLAGGNLVVVFDAGVNHPVAIAVLGSTENDRFTDVDALVAATTAHFSGVAPQP